MQRGRLAAATGPQASLPRPLAGEAMIAFGWATAESLANGLGHPVA